MNSITIGYYADGPWSHQALAELVIDPSIRIAFVCARSDRPDPILQAQAATHGIRFIAHPKINSDEFLELAYPSGCDLFVSMSFNQIFGKRLRERPRLGTINCHAGKLPFYRGRNILNWALINDEKEFGITVHYVNQGIDTGDILAQRVYPITDLDTYATVLERAYYGCAELLVNTIKRLQSGDIRAVPQSDIHPVGFYCTARRNGDERLSWNQTSREIFNFVRAICEPGPQARTFVGTAEIKINHVQLVPDAPTYKGIPGAVVGIEAGSLLVKTADSYVRVVEWNGVERVRIGDRFE